MLIAAGADVNATSNTGWTPLHTTSQYGYTDIAKVRSLHRLISFYDGRSQVLIAAGADVNAKIDKGHTPLNMASAYGHIDIAKVTVLAAIDQLL